MRKRLWMLFHLGTLAVLGLLTIANVVTMLRPFAPGAEGPTSTSSIGGLAANDPSTTALAVSGRAPANYDSEALRSAKNPLKTAQVGCESSMRLRVFDTVRQVRLQFDACGRSGKTATNDDVTGIFNSTNGFEATLFGATANREDNGNPALATESTPGIFSAPVKKRTIASEKPVKARTVSTSVSTDYISLTPGANVIKIQREGREQTLRIERK